MALPATSHGAVPSQNAAECGLFGGTTPWVLPVLRVQAGGATVSRDDEHRFRPKPGRVGRGGDGKATASFFTKVGKVARRHGMGGSSGAAIGPGVASPASRHGGAAGRGVAGGRGAAFVRACDLGRGWSHRRPDARRVVVKARFVRAAGQGGSRGGASALRPARRHLAGWRARPALCGERGSRRR